MNWWRLFGMNPGFKEFIEKNPDTTMLGMAWAINWRLMILVFIVELVFLVILSGAFFFI